MKPKLIAAFVLFVAFAGAIAALAQMRRPDPATMGAYVVGIFVRGPKWTPERTPHTDSLQAGHLANIRAMANSGELLGAGPFAGTQRERGLLIFKDLPLDSLATLVRRDPSMKAERLMVELYRWYAPRGIGVAYRERAKLRPENPDSMILVPVAFLNAPATMTKMDSTEAMKAQMGHMGHILDMLKSGQLLAAGPLFDDGPIRGLSFFGTDSATADRLAHDDPAVKAGRMNIVMYQFWTAWGVMPPTPTMKEMGR